MICCPGWSATWMPSRTSSCGPSSRRRRRPWWDWARLLVSPCWSLPAGWPWPSDCSGRESSHRCSPAEVARTAARRTAGSTTDAGIVEPLDAPGPARLRRGPAPPGRSGRRGRGPRHAAPPGGRGRRARDGHDRAGDRRRHGRLHRDRFFALPRRLTGRARARGPGTTPLAAAELVAGLPEAAPSLHDGAARRRPAHRTGGHTVAGRRAGRTPATPRPAARWRRSGWPCAGRAPTGTRSAASISRCRPAADWSSPGRAAPGRARCSPSAAADAGPTAGGVFMHGVDTHDLRGDDVRGRIAWCGPAPHLFDSTLRENLRLARPDASDARVITALHRAGLGPGSRASPRGWTPGSAGTAVRLRRRTAADRARPRTAGRPPGPAARRTDRASGCRDRRPDLRGCPLHLGGADRDHHQPSAGGVPRPAGAPARVPPCADPGHRGHLHGAPACGQPEREEHRHDPAGAGRPSPRCRVRRPRHAAAQPPRTCGCW